MSDIFYSFADRETLRRQFRISIVMIVAMSICAFILGFVTPITHSRKAMVVDNGQALMGRLMSISDY